MHFSPQCLVTLLQGSATLYILLLILRQVKLTELHQQIRRHQKAPKQKTLNFESKTEIFKIADLFSKLIDTVL